jgi:ABC-type glycerol-3-phosphate transport system substrate-binding protein
VKRKVLFASVVLLMLLAACAPAATPTSPPPTAKPPTAVPPTAVPPTAVPPTAVPPTAVPPTAVPPTPTTAPSGLMTPEQAALAAVGGSPIGGSVTVLAEWTGAEQDAFMAMVAPFQTATGVTINYTGTRNLPADLTTLVQGGNPPDLSVMPTPGVLRTLASQGALVDLTTVLDMNQINQWYTPGWLDLGTVGNKLYAVFMKSTIKGLIWYDPKNFTYSTPATWDDMVCGAGEWSRNGVAWDGLAGGHRTAAGRGRRLQWVVARDGEVDVA